MIKEHKIGKVGARLTVVIVARTSQRAKLEPSAEPRQMLIKTAQSRTAPARLVQRERILRRYVDGENFTMIVPRAGKARRIVYLCVDKALAMGMETTLADLPRTLARDYDHKRLGTASILASLDLQDGHITARGERKNRSREFIQLLQELDVHYPDEAVIRGHIVNLPLDFPACIRRAGIGKLVGASSPPARVMEWQTCGS